METARVKKISVLRCQISEVVVFFNKGAGLRPATLLKKRLWHRCFRVNFAKFLRTPFFIERLWWLLVKYIVRAQFNTDRNYNTITLVKVTKLIFYVTKTIAS